MEDERIIRDVEEIQRMKQQPGKDMVVWGGATLVSSLMNLGLIDELRLMINPLVLGGGKALFKDVKGHVALISGLINTGKSCQFSFLT
jgi:dihydrofolate reductase